MPIDKRPADHPTAGGEPALPSSTAPSRYRLLCPTCRGRILRCPHCGGPALHSLDVDDYLAWHPVHHPCLHCGRSLEAVVVGRRPSARPLRHRFGRW